MQSGSSPMVAGRPLPDDRGMLAQGFLLVPMALCLVFLVLVDVAGD